jgi:putative transposase
LGAFNPHEQDFNAHVDYIHHNPVHHGLVNNVRDWQYSSFHRYVQQGIYDLDWGSGEMVFDLVVGRE